MEIGRVEIPTQGKGKYAELWAALTASDGKHAVTVSGLSTQEVQQVRTSARVFVRKATEYRFASSYSSGVLTCWLRRSELPVGRSLSAVRQEGAQRH